ncbi:unnamed protein product [Closterium sp. Naga37s-1]|nr:unnamed protein product [Closterium sp. Naga37s-1]
MPSQRDLATPWQRLRSRVFRVQEVSTLFASSDAAGVDTWHSPRSPDRKSTVKDRDGRTGEAESAEAAEWGGGGGGEATLKRSLGWADTISLGVASIIGAGPCITVQHREAPFLNSPYFLSHSSRYCHLLPPISPPCATTITGVFVITGVAARDHAGPSVILSYLLSATSALLSALCYTEFAVHLPVAGGAFSYLMVTLGELPAFITVANLLMEYILSNAAAARGLSAYFAGFLGQDPEFFRLPVPAWGITLDFVALGLILSLSVLVAYGTQESSYFNFLASGLSMLAIVIIIVAGFTAGSLENITASFAPFGMQGMLDAAALVYFCFIGFDAVTTLAEEVANPAVDLPIGIVGSVAVVAVIYGFMALSLCLLVPYPQIDADAPFSSALRQLAGWGWAAGVVAAGALLAIVTAVLVGLMGQARIVLVVARAELLPKQFASVSPVTRTPLFATAVLGVATGVMALLVDLETLASMVSIGTLLIFLMVALALLLHRYHPRVTLPAPLGPTPVAACAADGAAAHAAAPEGAGEEIGTTESTAAGDDGVPLMANEFHSRPYEANPPAVLSPRKHQVQAAQQQNENGRPTEGKLKRRQRQKQGGGEGMGVVLMHLGVIVAGAAGVAVAFRVLPGHTAPALLSAALWAAATASLAVRPSALSPSVCTTHGTLFLMTAVPPPFYLTLHSHSLPFFCLSLLVQARGSASPYWCRHVVALNTLSEPFCLIPFKLFLVCWPRPTHSSPQHLPPFPPNSPPTFPLSFPHFPLNSIPHSIAPQCCREAEATRVFSVPLCPWLPSASILVNTVLLASLDTSAFIRFIVWSAIVTIGYVLMVLLSREPKGEYRGNKGEHGSTTAASALSPAAESKADDTGDVELTPLVTHAQT